MDDLIRNTGDILLEIKNISNLPSYLCALATFLAALTALFKEELSNYFLGPKIKTNVTSIELCENLIDKPGDDDDGPVKVAGNYTLDLTVINYGKKTCKNCEFYLDKVEFKKNTNDEYNELFSAKALNKPLWISENKLTEIDIGPYERYCVVRLLTIGSPSSRKNKKACKTNVPSKPELLIGAMYLKEDQVNEGIYKMSYSMIAANSKRLNFVVEVEWNSKWANRRSDMDIKIKGRLV